MQEELTIQMATLQGSLSYHCQSYYEILSHIHSSRLGAEACFSKASDVVFWPHMNTYIKEEVDNLATCTTWEFAHITSSLYHSSSNGKAENCKEINQKESER